MSLQQLNFALCQGNLEPEEQLALIMIADSCGDEFTKEEAIRVIWSYTGISEPKARSIVQSLCDYGLIHFTPYKQSADNSDHYVIWVTE